MIIPESIIQLTDIYSNETVNKFLQEAEEFLSRIHQIDIVGQLKTVSLIFISDVSVFQDSRIIGILYASRSQKLSRLDMGGTDSGPGNRFENIFVAYTRFSLQNKTTAKIE